MPNSRSSDVLEVFGESQEASVAIRKGKQEGGWE